MSKKFKVGDEVVWVGKHDNGAVGIVLNIDKGKYDVKWLSGCCVGSTSYLTALHLEPYEESSSNKNSPRPHADLIKAWADGAEIEVWNKYTQEWVYEDKPEWYEYIEYRIKEKPQTIKYRLGLVKYNNEHHIEVVRDSVGEVTLQTCPYFVRWITEWNDVPLT